MGRKSVPDEGREIAGDVRHVGGTDRRHAAARTALRDAQREAGIPRCLARAACTLDGSDTLGNDRDFILKYRLADAKIESGLLLSQRRERRIFSSSLCSRRSA